MGCKPLRGFQPGKEFKENKMGLPTPYQEYIHCQDMLDITMKKKDERLGMKL